jgi:hypothetical protein
MDPKKGKVSVNMKEISIMKVILRIIKDMVLVLSIIMIN